MRILHLTDIHYNTTHLEWVVAHQDEYDVICLTGDLIDDNHNQEASTQEQIDFISKWVLSINTPIFICSGNHDELTSQVEMPLEDLFSLDDEYESFESESNEGSLEWLNDLSLKDRVWTDRQVHTIGGITFGCIPYGCESFERYRLCDVILYHVPPSKTETAQDNYGDHGCNLIRREIESKSLKAKWVLSGHIHQPRKPMSKLALTSISNPGSHKKLIPKHHIIKL